METGSLNENERNLITRSDSNGTQGSQTQGQGGQGGQGLGQGGEGEETEYWRKNISELKQTANIVLIHVCDENR